MHPPPPPPPILQTSTIVVHHPPLTTTTTAPPRLPSLLILLPLRLFFLLFVLSFLTYKFTHNNESLSPPLPNISSSSFRPLVLIIKPRLRQSLIFFTVKENFYRHIIKQKSEQHFLHKQRTKEVEGKWLKRCPDIFLETVQGRRKILKEEGLP